MTLQEVPAKLVKSHGVASGKTKDSEFPQGTISATTLFRLRGLDLCDFYLGSVGYLPTLLFCNDQTSVFASEMVPKPPAENFSFYPVLGQ